MREVANGGLMECKDVTGGNAEKTDAPERDWVIGMWMECGWEAKLDYMPSTVFAWSKYSNLEMKRNK